MLAVYFQRINTHLITAKAADQDHHNEKINVIFDVNKGFLYFCVVFILKHKTVVCLISFMTTMEEESATPWI